MRREVYLHCSNCQCETKAKINISDYIHDRLEYIVIDFCEYCLDKEKLSILGIEGQRIMKKKRLELKLKSIEVKK